MWGHSKCVRLASRRSRSVSRVYLKTKQVPVVMSRGTMVLVVMSRGTMVPVVMSRGTMVLGADSKTHLTSRFCATLKKKAEQYQFWRWRLPGSVQDCKVACIHAFATASRVACKIVR